MVQNIIITNTQPASGNVQTNNGYPQIRNVIRRTSTLKKTGFSWGIMPTRRTTPFGTTTTDFQESLNAHKNNFREYNGGSNFYDSSERTRKLKLNSIKRGFNSKRL